MEFFETSGNLIGNALVEKFLRKGRSRDFATHYWREFTITLQNTPVNCLGLLRFGYHSTTIQSLHEWQFLSHSNVLQKVCDYSFVGSWIYSTTAPLMIWNGLGALNYKAWCKPKPSSYIKPLSISSAEWSLLSHTLRFQMVAIAFGVGHFLSWKRRALIKF